MIELESLEDASEDGFYLVQVCEYPDADKKRRVYQVYRFNEQHEWFERLHGARTHAVIYGWHGPLRLANMEALDDPNEMGYYVVLLQPWPGQSPKFKEFRVCVWRRGAWYDQYGFAKQYGNVIAWAGPFQSLPETPWLAQHEREEAEDIGL